ncbi:MAG: hypothetical protein H8E86_05990 [Planctomycetes bacterium]|nr:hypothetical protein [Planctomycetota bacterium]
MTKSCGTNGNACPMMWILGGAIVGTVVGLFTENLGLWVGIGAGSGVVLFLLRSMCKSGGCCGSGKSESCSNENQEKE